jgi:hypothetical protein
VTGCRASATMTTGPTPGTFDFLGFTVHWGRSPMTGKWVVKTRTAADRFRRTLKRVSQWCKENRHAPLETQQRAPNQKLRGHYGYFGRKGNRARLWALLHRIVPQWWRWLSRRSQRGLSWEEMTRLLQRYRCLRRVSHAPRSECRVSKSRMPNRRSGSVRAPGRKLPRATRPLPIRHPARAIRARRRNKLRCPQLSHGFGGIVQVRLNWPASTPVHFGTSHSTECSRQVHEGTGAQTLGMSLQSAPCSMPVGET